MEKICDAGSTSEEKYFWTLSKLLITRTKLAEIPECANCEWRSWDDDAWHTLFVSGIPKFQEETMTTLQETGEEPFIPDSLVLTKLSRAEGLDQVTAFAL